jgi:hypothetical protein
MPRGMAVHVPVVMAAICVAAAAAAAVTCVAAAGVVRCSWEWVAAASRA